MTEAVVAVGAGAVTEAVVGVGAGAVTEAVVAVGAGAVTEAVVAVEAAVVMDAAADAVTLAREFGLPNPFRHPRFGPVPPRPLQPRSATPASAPYRNPAEAPRAAGRI